MTDVVNLRKYSIKCSNFKCFDGSHVGVDEIAPINVIIGRNNSGKSTLLDAIKHAILENDIANLGHKGVDPLVLLSEQLSEKHWDQIPAGQFKLESSGITWFFYPRRWAANRAFV